MRANSWARPFAWAGLLAPLPKPPRAPEAGGRNEGCARREFLQTIGMPLLFRPRRRVRLTIAAPGRVPAGWTLRTQEAHRRAREYMRSGVLGRVVFVSCSTATGAWRLAIHGADATLTLQEAA